ncbi:hypothetical protein TherJR_0388 [Thermincola potens JR]|uniref:Uncharacterized protein n=1 Tax=Thermincola potens (strain JR) TaxID=635013 RepID=D5XAH5_THEPJ|nr:hypothetical protein TherJR_0388 [Thermincola potens JR]
MGKTGLMYVTGLAGLLCGFIAVWIGNPIRPIHYILSILLLFFMILSGYFYYGSLEKTHEKVLMVIIMVLFLFIAVKRYLF